MTARLVTIRGVRPSADLPPAGPPEWLRSPRDTSGEVVPVEATVVHTEHVCVGLRLRTIVCDDSAEFRKFPTTGH